MDFEWDVAKAASNVARHGVSFDQAATACGSSVLELRLAESDVTTKRAKEADPEMRDEYDFSDGVRGKYAERYREGTNVRVLDADLAAKFKTSEAVNQALREYLQKVNEA